MLIQGQKQHEHDFNVDSYLNADRVLKARPGVDRSTNSTRSQERRRRCKPTPGFPSPGVSLAEPQKPQWEVRVRGRSWQRAHVKTKSLATSRAVHVCFLSRALPASTIFGIGNQNLSLRLSNFVRSSMQRVSARYCAALCLRCI